MALHLTSIRRAERPIAYLRAGFLLALALLALTIFMVATALAQPAPAPEPKPDPLAETARLVKTAQAALAAAESAARQAAASQAATQSVMLVPRSTEVAIPAEIRDAVVSLCGILITAGVAAGLTWMRKHFAFMQEAGANAAITSSAQGLGALLEQTLAKQGKSLATVDISDPMVASLARKLVASYPEWGPLVGLTQDIAERKVLAGAIQQSAVPILPAPTVAVVQPAPVPVVEAAATPQHQPA